MARLYLMLGQVVFVAKNGEVAQRLLAVDCTKISKQPRKGILKCLKGHSYLLRLLTSMLGTPYAKTDTLSADFHYNIDQFMATMDRALDDV